MQRADLCVLRVSLLVYNKPPSKPTLSSLLVLALEAEDHGA